MKAAPSARIPANKAMVRSVKRVRCLCRSSTGGEVGESLLLIVSFHENLCSSCATFRASLGLGRCFFDLHFFANWNPIQPEGSSCCGHPQ